MSRRESIEYIIEKRTEKIEAANDQDDQERLAVIAKKDENPNIRIAAINRIVNQADLIEISVTDNERHVCRAAAERSNALKVSLLGDRHGRSYSEDLISRLDDVIVI